MLLTIAWTFRKARRQRQEGEDMATAEVRPEER